MKSWFTIRNSADSAEIDIFDEIGMFGVSARQFVDQLRAAGKLKNITVNLDSPGGDCNDGFTIYDALKACQASVTVNITGLAASMASVIMLAADKGKIRIAENGRVMIHRVTGGANGTSDDLAAATQLIRQFEERIVALYAARTGKADADIREMMKAQLGTWFFGQEAIDAGFADTLIAGAKARAFKPEWASLFTMLPAALFDTHDFRNAPTHAHPMNPLRTSILTILGLAETPEKPLADAEIIAAFNKALGDVGAIVTERDTLKNSAGTLTATNGTLTTQVANLTANLATATATEKAAKDSLAALHAQLKTSFGIADADLAALDGAKLGACIEQLAANKAIALAASQGAPPVLKDWNKDTGEKTMTRAEFKGLSHPARAAFMKAGGTITD